MKIMNKKVLVASLLIVSAIVASFTALSFIAKAQLTTVSIEPPWQEVVVCNDFSVDVLVTELVEEMDAFEFFVWYNPDEVTPNIVFPGPFIPPQDVFNWQINNVEGWVQGYTTPTNGFTISGTGVIATIDFHCKRASLDSPLTLESQLIRPDLSLIPHADISGSVTQMYLTSFTYVEPATYTVPICVPFTVNVKVNGMSNLHSFQLVLTYDNTAAVDCVDIVPGDFLPLPTVDHKLIDDAVGRIEFNVTAGVAWGTSGSGTIATITFHCTGAGESVLTVDTANYFDPDGNWIPTITSGGRVIQKAYWEPLKLQHIVEWPGILAYADIPFAPPASPEGYHEIMAELEYKGYLFDDPTTGTAMEVTGSIDEEEFSGTVTSWWSSNTLEDGTRACMLSAEMDDGTSMAMAFVTNLLPPEQIPGVDPYIIVNAMPYMYVRFYWWHWGVPGHIVTWPYWWYDSHSHPNWFWGPYWWWRCHTKAYYLGMPWPPVDINWAYWRPWWGWWWHWTYWRHWYWWSSYFPYDP